MILDTPQEALEKIMKKQAERRAKREKAIALIFICLILLFVFVAGAVMGVALTRRKVEQAYADGEKAGIEYERSLKRKALIEIGDSFDKKWECFIVE